MDSALGIIVYLFIIHFLLCEYPFSYSQVLSHLGLIPKARCAIDARQSLDRTPTVKARGCGAR